MVNEPSVFELLRFNYILKCTYNHYEKGLDTLCGISAFSAKENNFSDFLHACETSFEK